jgi:hypothetical protein
LQSLHIALEKSIFSDIKDSKLFLLNKLQSLHDNYDPKLWLERLSSLAEERGLNDEILKKFEVSEKH